MAVEWQGAMDPAERVEYIASFTGGDEPVLRAGETIASYSLAVSAEGAALGLTIENAGEYVSRLVDVVDGEAAPGSSAILIWLSVAPEMQSNEVFVGGAKVGVIATIETTATPPRRRERTWLVELRQL